MPDFDKVTFVGKLVSIVVKEGDFGPQIAGEIERLDDRPDRNVWIPIPYDRDNDRPNPITKGTTLGQWATAVLEVEPEVETLDFRTPQRAKALKRLCTILEGNYYSWENREYSYPSGSKDRLTPVEKYATEELAMAAAGEGISVTTVAATAGGLAVPNAWKGIEEDWKDTVRELKEELKGKPESAISKLLENRRAELETKHLATPDEFLAWWDEV